MYKSGNDNTVADALSKMSEIEDGDAASQLRLLTSVIISGWTERMKVENKSDPWIQEIKAKITRGKRIRTLW